jgi:hypothetical protein
MLPSVPALKSLMVVTVDVLPELELAPAADDVLPVEVDVLAAPTLKLRPPFDELLLLLDAGSTG